MPYVIRLCAPYQRTIYYGAQSSCPSPVLADTLTPWATREEAEAARARMAKMGFGLPLDHPSCAIVEFGEVPIEVQYTVKAKWLEEVAKALEEKVAELKAAEECP